MAGRTRGPSLAPLYSTTPRMVRFRTRYHLDEEFREKVLQKNREKEAAGGERAARLKYIRRRMSELRAYVEKLQGKLEKADRELVELAGERERIKRK